MVTSDFILFPHNVTIGPICFMENHLYLYKFQFFFTKMWNFRLKKNTNVNVPYRVIFF